jgi:predicted transcriptional regulator
MAVFPNPEQAILEAVRECEPAGVDEIRRVIWRRYDRIGRTTVQQHLKRLTQSGRVVREIRGKTYFYRPADATVAPETTHPPAHERTDRTAR